jgi:TPR repeat protein
MDSQQDSQPATAPIRPNARVHWIAPSARWIETLGIWVSAGRTKEALPWLLAYRRNAWAQLLIGDVRWQSAGKSKKALGWYQRAYLDSDEHGLIALRLARCYAKGIGTQVNPLLAHRWYLIAARLEIPEIFEGLGDLEASGLLQPINRLRACMWFAICCMLLKDEGHTDRVQDKMMDLLWDLPHDQRTEVLNKAFDDAMQWAADHWND